MPHCYNNEYELFCTVLQPGVKGGCIHLQSESWWQDETCSLYLAHVNCIGGNWDKKGLLHFAITDSLSLEIHLRNIKKIILVT